VHVEDHPLEYASFEGEIPAGQYGAGRVEIYDRGSYELVEERRSGGLTVRLDGRRLRGTWTLAPDRGRERESDWLIVRRSGDEPPPRRATRREAPASPRPRPRPGSCARRSRRSSSRAS
jgi:bifunctional non-homologous end joining protein LigD